MTNYREGFDDINIGCDSDSTEGENNTSPPNGHERRRDYRSAIKDGFKKLFAKMKGEPGAEKAPHENKGTNDQQDQKDLIGLKTGVFNEENMDTQKKTPVRDTFSPS